MTTGSGRHPRNDVDSCSAVALLLHRAVAERDIALVLRISRFRARSRRSEHPLPHRRNLPRGRTPLVSARLARSSRRGGIRRGVNQGRRSKTIVPPKKGERSLCREPAAQDNGGRLLFAARPTGQRALRGQYRQRSVASSCAGCARYSADLSRNPYSSSTQGAGGRRDRRAHVRPRRPRGVPPAKVGQYSSEWGYEPPVAATARVLRRQRQRGCTRARRSWQSCVVRRGLPASTSRSGAILNLFRFAGAGRGPTC